MTRIKLIENVIKDFNAGISFGEIGKKYGKTRSAVAGIISRARASDPNAVTVNHLRRKTIAKPPVPFKAPVHFNAYEGIKSKPGAYLITELPANGCKYSTETVNGTHLFCGIDAKEGSSYCPRHHKRVTPAYAPKGELGRRPSAFKIFNR